MSARQDFKTIDRIRLDVQTTPMGLPNYAKNPGGELGSWAYITPNPTGIVNRVFLTSTETSLALQSTGSGPDYCLTEPTPVTPGRSVGGRIDVLGRAGQTAGARLVFFNAAGAVVGTGAQGTVTGGSTFTTLFAGVTTAPAGTVTVALRLDGSRTDVNPIQVPFRNTMLTHSAATVPATYAYVPPVVWRNILAPAHEINIDREGLNPGTLSAVVFDATLDPSTADALRPGKAVQVWSIDAQQPIFSGTITNAQVVYDLKQRKPSHRAKITLTAVDNAAKISNVVRPNGVANVFDLREAFEGAGVPYILNGTPDQFGAPDQFGNTPAVVATVPDASLLDQVVLTRDTVRGYAWCNRFGQIAVYDAAALTNLVGTAATLSESVYSDIDVDYNTDDCINVVTVKLLRPNLATGETVEVAYGPYRNQASIDQWGAYSTEFRVQGLADNEATVAAYAQAILDANSTPKVRVNGVRLPIKNVSDFSAASGSKRALLDLYDRVTITRPDPPVDPFPTTFSPEF